MRPCRRLPFGPATGAAMIVAAFAVTSVVSSRPATAAVPAGARAVASAWTARVCAQVVEFQAAALEAREAFAVARTSAPADRAAQEQAATSLAEALAPVRGALRTLDRSLSRAAPEGRGGVAVRDGLREALGPVHDAYATARGEVGRLRTVRAARYPRAAATVLDRLDRDLERATGRLTRLEPTVTRAAVGQEVAEQAACRAVGFEWAALLTEAGTTGTPPAPATSSDAAGASDRAAPRLLLPGRYRPSAPMAALAAEAGMSALGRLHFYSGLPSVETGTGFVADCPSGDAASAQILGCYVDGRIYVLAVTRSELAQVVTVTAAHEMLHAVYEAMTVEEREQIDALTASFSAGSPDARLAQIVAQYERRNPDFVPNELHSLIPTQVAALTPELEAHYARYFRDRALVVVAYDAYASVFEGLIGRYESLQAQVGELRARIEGLRAQADAASGEAARLADQIDTLRAQGRIGESNALVPTQIDAFRRAQGLSAEGNRLIEEHNALIAQLDAVAQELTGLESALRPLG